MLTSDLLTMLRRHYIPETGDLMARDGGSFAHEVSANGPGSTRRADALYAGYTSASGRILIGHELKVSRADWRAELAKVGKADDWSDACHAWYVVAPSTDIVPVEELPHGWGLMLPPRSKNGRRMTVKVRAEVKTDYDPPWWAVRAFLARLDTLACQHHTDRNARIINAQVQMRAERLRENHAPAALSREDQNRLDAAKRIEAETGMTISAYLTNIEDGEVAASDLVRGARISDMLRHGTGPLLHLDRELQHAERAMGLLRATLPHITAAINAENSQPADPKQPIEETTP